MNGLLNVFTIQQRYHQKALEVTSPPPPLPPPIFLACPGMGKGEAGGRGGWEPQRILQCLFAAAGPDAQGGSSNGRTGQSGTGTL
jgi:hypothetical protein